MNRQRLLIAEDNSALRTPLCEYLGERLQLDVHAAADREEALALLESYPYGAVVTDLRFSDHSLEGIDIIEAAANLNKRPAIIVLSSHASDDIRNVAARKGADAFLQKPQSLATVADVIGKLLALRELNPARQAKSRFSGALLEDVLGDHGVTTYVQPIVELSPNQIQAIVTGLECLVRGPANTPFERADVLFSYACHKHAEKALDRHCIELALRALVQIPANLRLSINAHPCTVAEQGFPCWLFSVAEKSSISPDRLTLEVVEQGTVWDRTNFCRNLSELRQARVRIALDDFGLGHSNYQMMVDTSPDYFKLDRYFVDGCSRDKYKKAVCSSVVTLASEFAAQIVAEGVETMADVQELTTLGISLFQGYLFSRPIPTATLEQQSLLLCNPALRTDQPTAAVGGAL